MDIIYGRGAKGGGRGAWAGSALAGAKKKIAPFMKVATVGYNSDTGVTYVPKRAHGIANERISSRLIF